MYLLYGGNLGNPREQFINIITTGDKEGERVPMVVVLHGLEWLVQCAFASDIIVNLRYALACTRTYARRSHRRCRHRTAFSSRLFVALQRWRTIGSLRFSPPAVSSLSHQDAQSSWKRAHFLLSQQTHSFARTIENLHSRFHTTQSLSSNLRRDRVKGGKGISRRGKAWERSARVHSLRHPSAVQILVERRFTACR
jgi:hypothetical protein